MPFKSERIPRATIRRLAIYVQVLEVMRRNGVQIISSGPLAKACEVNASQVRRDLAYFGEFGVRGVGYNVSSLIQAIRASLGVDREWTVALVGIGNLGRALLHYGEFRSRGFHIARAYDISPQTIGQKVYGLEVRPMSQIIEDVPTYGIEIGILATPPEAAQKAANLLVEAGVQGIMNFAPVRITAPNHIFVEYVDFFHYLYAIAFNITTKQP